MWASVNWGDCCGPCVSPCRSSPLNGSLCELYGGSVGLETASRKHSCVLRWPFKGGLHAHLFSFSFRRKCWSNCQHDFFFNYQILLSDINIYFCQLFISLVVSLNLMGNAATGCEWIVHKTSPTMTCRSWQNWQTPTTYRYCGSSLMLMFAPVMATALHYSLTVQQTWDSHSSVLFIGLKFLLHFCSCTSRELLCVWLVLLRLVQIHVAPSVLCIRTQKGCTAVCVMTKWGRNISSYTNGPVLHME